MVDNKWSSDIITTVIAVKISKSKYKKNHQITLSFGVDLSVLLRCSHTTSKTIPSRSILSLMSPVVTRHLLHARVVVFSSVDTPQWRVTSTVLSARLTTCYVQQNIVVAILIAKSNFGSPSATLAYMIKEGKGRKMNEFNVDVLKIKWNKECNLSESLKLRRSRKSDGEKKQKASIYLKNIVHTRGGNTFNFDCFQSLSSVSRISLKSM